MTNIHKNRNVKHRGDVQNVITSAILRQSGWFSKDDVYNKVELELKFSSFGKYGKKRKEIDVTKMITDTLNKLWNINSITYDSNHKKYKLTMSFPAISKR